MKRFLVMFIIACSGLLFPFRAVSYELGEDAYHHLLKFSLIGNRALVSESERTSRDYIVDRLNDMGYKVKTLKFKVKDYDTYNIEVNKKGKDSSKTILIGAHYDGRAEGNAFDDNGSGISILLELCDIFKNIDTKYNLKFMFFGAEEINVLGNGLHGSYDYVESLSKKQKENIKLMINLDTLVCGDRMYVYNAYKEMGVSEESKEIFEKFKEVSNGRINFNLREDGVSFTNTKSDYFPFFEENIPVLYFESTNWDAYEKDGRSQTELLGRVIHSKMDNMTFIENIFTDRIKSRLSEYVKVIKEFILSDI